MNRAMLSMGKNVVRMIWLGLTIVALASEVDAQGARPRHPELGVEPARPSAAELDERLERIGRRLQVREGADRCGAEPSIASWWPDDPANPARELDRLRQEIARMRSEGLRAEAERKVLAERVGAAVRERDLAAAAAERSARAVQAALAQRDRANGASDELRRRMAAAFSVAQAASVDREAASAASLAALRARLGAAEKARVEVMGGPGQPAKDAPDAPPVEYQDQIDMLVAERDKAQGEAAATRAGFDVRLADAERRLAAMSEEVGKAWSERVSAEQRIEHVAAQADIVRSQSERMLAGERAARTDLMRELAAARARAAAFDSLLTTSSRRSVADSAERDEMRDVAGRAVEQTAKLTKMLFESLDQTRIFAGMLADAKLQLSTETGDEQPADLPGDWLGQVDGRLWPVAAVTRDEPSGSRRAEHEHPAIAPSLPILARLTGLVLQPVGDGWIKAVAGGIGFAAGEVQIGAGSSHGLEQVAVLLRLMPGASARIVGHTDDHGDISANDDLSRRRALVVRTALINEFEIDGSRIEADGVGATEPIASNATAAGRSTNRRVEVFVARRSAVVGQHRSGEVERTAQ